MSIIALSILYIQCAKNEPKVDYPDKNIPYLDAIEFFDIETQFEVNFVLENVEEPTFTLYSYNVTTGEKSLVKELGQKAVPFTIPKDDFGDLEVGSIFILKAQASGVMRESYIEYKSIFPESLSYGKSYKGVEGKRFEDTATITLNKEVADLTWTVKRKINSAGNFLPLTVQGTKLHQKFWIYTLSTINNGLSEGGEDTIIYEFTISLGENNKVMKQYKEPVKVDALTKSITTTLNFNNNAFSQRMPLAPNGITLTEKDYTMTVYSIMEGKFYKYLDLLLVKNYANSLQFHLYENTGADLRIATLGNEVEDSRLTFVSTDDATLFKQGNRIKAENEYSAGARAGLAVASISVKSIEPKYYAVKLENQEIIKSKVNPKVDSLIDVTYFGFLETISRSFGASLEVGEVVLNLKCSPKRDYTKE